jgi:hypothetical protein
MKIRSAVLEFLQAYRQTDTRADGHTESQSDLIGAPRVTNEMTGEFYTYMGKKEKLKEFSSENLMESGYFGNMGVYKKIFKWIIEKQVIRM